MEKKIDPKGKEKKQTNRKKWYKAVCSLAAAVVVCTVYTLMLPALTLDEESAGDAGVTISESAVPASESPAAAESSPSDNGSESHSDTAADSSADSSPASAESGPAEAAPSADSAPSTNEPTTLPSQDGENHTAVTLPAEETNNGAITGSSESQDEVTTPDTDDQEEIKDEESGSPAADSEEADNNGSSADAEEDDSEKSDDTADVETASDWETTIPDLSDCETWAEKLLAVAGSQLGYHESVLNFRVDNDGNHKGYTRYGEWYGSPYGDWCAMFVSFCLNYAGIENNDSIIPYNANCNTWVEQLIENKIFEDPDTYLPEPGDIVFFDQSGSGKADHVGIVSEVEYGTKTVKRHVVVGTETAVEDSAIALLTYANSLISEETPAETLEATETEVAVAKSIEVTEGNSSDQVQTVTYDMTDSSILGFASMLEAEYINDGGDIDDIKNTNHINQPVTLEDKIATQANEVNVQVGGTSIINSIYGDCYNHEWSTSTKGIIKVTPNGESCTIEGLKKGTTILYHTFYYNGDKYSKYESWNINVVEKLDVVARVFYLKTPTSNPDSNNTSEWGIELGTNAAKVNVTGATWSNNKNIFTDVNKYVVSWPDGKQHSTLENSEPKWGWEITKGTYKYWNNSQQYDHWNVIYTAFKDSLSKKYGININESDIEHIYLVPYKISTNEDGYHIDCTVDIACKDIYTARFWVIMPDGQPKQVDAKNYRVTEDVQKTDKKVDDVIYYDNGIKYKLDTNWYTEAGKDDNFNSGVIDSWPYEPAVKKGTVNFYTRYIPQTITINYKVAMGDGTVDRDNEKLTNGEDALGSTPTPGPGWLFEGWYADEACSESNKISDSSWVAEDGKITPQPDNEGNWNYADNGKTYYAKFVSGVQLPETGAPGTTLIYLLGAMLTTAPLTITFIKRRRQKKEEN